MASSSRPRRATSSSDSAMRARAAVARTSASLILTGGTLAQPSPGKRETQNRPRSGGGRALEHGHQLVGALLQVRVGQGGGLVGLVELHGLEQLAVVLAHDHGGRVEGDEEGA